MRAKPRTYIVRATKTLPKITATKDDSIFVSLDEAVHKDDAVFKMSTCELFAFNTGDFVSTKKADLGYLATSNVFFVVFVLVCLCLCVCVFLPLALKNWNSRSLHNVAHVRSVCSRHEMPKYGALLGHRRQLHVLNWYCEVTLFCLGFSLGDLGAP